jgi:ubiquinone/menaquinone biosynthesis C-methylase UbiE
MSLVSILENPVFFGFTQKLNPFTTSLYAAFAKRYIAADSNQTVLDIGCGLGVHRRLFEACRYTGIDINPQYVAHARRKYGDGFLVMDAGDLQFDNASFTQVLSIATCHHLDDATVQSMAREAMRVLKPEGALHIIDPVLPVSRPAPIKNLVFRNDRGRFQRTLGEMGDLFASVARVAKVDLRRTVFHDVCYFKVTGKA